LSGKKRRSYLKKLKLDIFRERGGSWGAKGARPGPGGRGGGARSGGGDSGQGGARVAHGLLGRHEEVRQVGRHEPEGRALPEGGCGVMRMGGGV